MTGNRPVQYEVDKQIRNLIGDRVWTGGVNGPWTVSMDRMVESFWVEISEVEIQVRRQVNEEL